MGLKVAICGLSESSRHLIPWEDKDWEKWGLAWDHERFEMDRTFEMHDMPLLKRYTAPAYIDGLNDLPSLYMVDEYPEVMNALRYPVEEVSETIHGDYFNSSVGFMLALAIHEGAEEIAIYGVDMRADEEYGYQRPNCEYLIGLARGKGIKVHIPDVSPLCKYQNDPGFAYFGRYGKSE